MEDDMPEAERPIERKRSKRLSDRVKRNSHSLDAHVMKLVSFQGDEELCRGVSLAFVFQRCGYIFESSRGSENTYSLSRHVQQIDAFISHNWDKPRFSKFIALSMHFNFRHAGIATVASLAVFAGLSAIDFIPAAVTIGDQYRSLCSSIAATPIFVAVLLGGSAWRSTLCQGFDTHVFIDKSCIDQADHDRKKKCIEKLGAYLQRSSSMVVLYSDVYLQRLWTVYEVASFLALHPIEQMYVIPDAVPQIMIIGTTLMYFCGIVTLVIDCSTDYEYVYDLLSIVPIAFMAFALRRMNHERAAMRARLATFTLDSCSCFNEADRPVVHRNIAALMRAACIIDGHATDEAALCEFEALVKTRLPEVLPQSGALRYEHVLVMALCGFGAHGLDKIFGAIPHGITSAAALKEVIKHCYSVSIIAPLGVACLCKQTSFCMGVTGTMEGIFVVSSALMVLTLGFSMNAACTEIAKRATSSSAWLAVSVVVWILGLASTSLAFGMHRRRKWQALDAFVPDLVGDPVRSFPDDLISHGYPAMACDESRGPQVIVRAGCTLGRQGMTLEDGDIKNPCEAVVSI